MSDKDSIENKNIYFATDLKQGTEEEALQGVFEGYAATFGNTDSANDVIMNGAFAASLRDRQPKVLWQHKMDVPVGKLLEASEDERGLYVKVQIADTTAGVDALKLMKMGVIDKLSIGFKVKEAEYDRERGARIIKRVDLLEFSLVTIPANNQAEITSLKSLPQTEREFERFLRETGFPRSAAKAITAKGFKSCLEEDQRDVDAGDSCGDQWDADVIKQLNELNKRLKNDRTK